MKNKKTIQLFHHYALPPSGAGVTRHFTLLKEIGKHGFSPFLIAANRHHRQAKDIPLPKSVHYRHDEALGVSMFFLKTLTNSASKAKRVLNSSALNLVIGPAPLFPFNNPSAKSLAVLPIGVNAPIPVITTLLIKRK